MLIFPIIGQTDQIISLPLIYKMYTQKELKKKEKKMEKKAEQTQGINNLQLIASKVCLYS